MKKYLFKLKGSFAITTFFIILFSTLNIMLSLVLKFIIDVAESKSKDQLYKAIIFALIYLVLFFLIGYIKKILQYRFVKNIMILVKKDIFNKIINKNMKSFDNENSAQYISTLTNDMNIIEEDYFINILNTIASVFSFILATILLIKFNIFITLGVFIVGSITISIPIFFSKKLSMRKKIYSDNLASFTVKLKDIFSGFEVIKSFNIENKITDEYTIVNSNTEISKYKFYVFSGLIDILSFSFGMLMFFTAISIGAYFTIQGKITIGTMIAATQLMNNIVNPIIDISSRLNKFKSVKLIEDKISKIIKEVDTPSIEINKDSFNNLIEFKNISFSYTKNKTTLDNISMDIKKGHKYAIVGRSGSGKSTILKILLRYFDDYNGNVYIDGIDHKKIKIEDLYQLISLIHQNVFLFDSSIKNNITLFNNYNEEDINRAIKLSGLQNLVDSLESGLDSLVGENGRKLSGGEKQRIAIARAIIKNTPIIILDEATSSLDNQTSYYIEKSLLDLENLTTIVITHKLSEELLSNYDTIFALKDGKLIEHGSFNNLMNKKGYFYSLYNTQ